LFDKNQRLTQLAGPSALIKAKRVKKITDALKDVGASDLRVLREIKKVGKLSWYGKSLLFTDSKKSLLVPHDSQIVLVSVGGGKTIS